MATHDLRIALDVLGAPADSGGMHRYARELIEAWIRIAPADRLLLIGNDWVKEYCGPGVEVAIRRRGALPRIVGQWIGSGAAARRWDASALISVSDVASPLFPRRARIAVVHDWRHRINPSEFGFGRRLYRRIRQWSVERAAAAVQISAKTWRETGTFAPNATRELIENGRDHASRWALAPKPQEIPYVLTFGHLPNKRAELVVRAFEQISNEFGGELVVLGAQREHARLLKELAGPEDTQRRVRLPGFVSDESYEQLVQHASVVVLASSDEGFGLPVCEANYLGIPCVVTTDSGLGEIHAGRVLVAAPRPDELGRAILHAMASGGREWRDPHEGWDAQALRFRQLVVSCLGLSG